MPFEPGRRAKILLHRSVVVPILRVQRGFFFFDMDVSGTIDVILSQKGADIYSISPEATVYEAIEMMAKKNVGALLFCAATNCAE